MSLNESLVQDAVSTRLREPGLASATEGNGLLLCTFRPPDTLQAPICTSQG